MPPAGRDLDERVEDETTVLQRLVRDDEAAVAKGALAEREDVQIQDPGAPGAAATAAEITLDRLEKCKQVRRGQRCFCDKNGVRKLPTAWADRRGSMNPRQAFRGDAA